jgi:hypothetical protein
MAVCLVATGTLLLPSCKFNNCSTMWRTWPHGVGNPNAVDRTSGTPKVSNFLRSGVEYSNNRGLDRDGDGIACERL